VSATPRGDAHGLADPGTEITTPRSARGPLAGVRIIEVSLLGAAAITTSLADLGAEVIKVESPAGDYIREMTWPIVEGVSLMHLHINRGKQSVVVDLKSEAGITLFKELVAGADAVVEAMRPGQLAKFGVGYDTLKAINPKIVVMAFSGYGSTGPYRTLPSHGVAFDTWAGIVSPVADDEGYCYLPERVSIGINAGPIHGALGLSRHPPRPRPSGHLWEPDLRTTSTPHPGCPSGTRPRGVERVRGRRAAHPHLRRDPPRPDDGPPMAPEPGSQTRQASSSSSSSVSNSIR